jgi:uncharacterized hydrophobic protein (TIGR00271 family)
MLHLRVFGSTSAMGNVAQRLEALPGARHVAIAAGVRDHSTLVTADVMAPAADEALDMLRELGIPARDVSLLRVEAIDPDSVAHEQVAIIWADLLGQARVNARTAVRYLLFMGVAGVIAAFGVIEEDQVLIVGAMAVAPDLLPITAACTGLVLRRWPLIRAGLGTVILGLGATALVAAVVTALLSAFDLLPAGFALHETGIGAQQHINAETISVALAAGLAGMLALETRASAGVGVAISVTTVPAAAFLGVALGIGELSKSLGALAVLAANVTMMLAGSSIALIAQRRLGSDGAEALPQE